MEKVDENGQSAGYMSKDSVWQEPKTIQWAYNPVTLGRISFNSVAADKMLVSDEHLSLWFLFAKIAQPTRCPDEKMGDQSS